MLSGSVGIVRVGANSKVELKEKRDRVEDAIYATKAALKEGIVPGGGIALLNASERLSSDSAGESILLEALRSLMDPGVAPRMGAAESRAASQPLNLREIMVRGGPQNIDQLLGR